MSYLRGELRRVLAVVSLLMGGSAGNAQELVSLSTRENVTQSYFLANVTDSSQGIALLFAGSGGFIRLRKEGDQIKFGNDNFLVRSRREFMTRGMIAAIVDAPSDQQGGRGMSDEFRLGEQHFTDVSAVIGDLHKRFPALGVFLIGTSRGSISAAALGARFGERTAGVVLTASTFRQTGRKAREPGIGLSRFDFSTIKAPLLIAHHVGDQCATTPYSDAARLAKKYPLITVWGGSPPQSGPCDSFSQHGFLGKESETVEQIVNWMLKKPFQYEVK